jgi:hypothetical protein
MKIKLSVICVAFLFLGVAIAPSINVSVVKASSDNDLVEVTTQACGIQGFGNTTVKLTKQQYQNLERYLVDFRARLNQTTTREETVPIFKEAVVELNKYGLLPKGMNIKQAQRLVTGEYIPEPIQRIIEELLKRTSLFNDKNQSIFCLIHGEGTYPEMYIARDAFVVLEQAFFNIWDDIAYFVINHLFLCFPLVLLFISFVMVHEFFVFNPARVLATISLQNVVGYVQSLGINGLRKWQGRLTGDIPRSWWDDFGSPGIVGFTGIGISSDIPTPYMMTYFIGTALRAKIIVE